MGAILVMFVLLSLSSAMVLSNEKIASNLIQFPIFKLIPQLITTPLKITSEPQPNGDDLLITVTLSHQKVIGSSIEGTCHNGYIVIPISQQNNTAEANANPPEAYFVAMSSLKRSNENDQKIYLNNDEEITTTSTEDYSTTDLTSDSTTDVTTDEPTTTPITTPTTVTPSSGSKADSYHHYKAILFLIPMIANFASVRLLK